MGQRPQFYYPVQVKQQNERRLILKSHLLVRVIEKIQIEYPHPPPPFRGGRKGGISLREKSVAWKGGQRQESVPFLARFPCFTHAHQLHSIPFPFLNASSAAY